jgi:hypothetical protein
MTDKDKEIKKQVKLLKALIKDVICEKAYIESRIVELTYRYRHTTLHIYHKPNYEDTIYS